jgi:hypothetical protein
MPKINEFRATLLAAVGEGRVAYWDGNRPEHAGALSRYEAASPSDRRHEFRLRDAERGTWAYDGAAHRELVELWRLDLIRTAPAPGDGDRVWLTGSGADLLQRARRRRPPRRGRAR